MNRFTIKPLRVLGFVAFILADIFIYFVLGMLFMGYEDFYDESKGPWLSLKSMTTNEKIVYFAINLWYIANIVLFIWTCYRVYKTLRIVR